MSGYHILLVKLKILYKKYNLLGLQQWWLKSNIIAEGLVSQAAEGKHYSRARMFIEIPVRKTCGCNEECKKYSSSPFS